MSSFFAGLITGNFIGIVLTLLVLMIVSGIKGPENAPKGQVPNRKVFLAALVLLAVCGACYTLALEKSALLALLLSVLLIAKLGGSKRGIAAAGLAASLVLAPQWLILREWPGQPLGPGALRFGDSRRKHRCGGESVAQAMDYHHRSRSILNTEVVPAGGIEPTA